MANRPSILLIRCGAVGDTVLATCAIEPVRQRWPEAQLEWLLTPASASLFAADPRIATIHRLHHRKLPIWLTPLKRRLIKQSRQQPYELVINMETAPHFRQLAQCLNSRARLSYGDEVGWLDRHGVDNHRRLLQHGGFDLQSARPSLRGAALPLQLPPAFVVLHPGNSHISSRQPNIRAWPEAHWQQLTQQLSAAGIATVITGTAAEAGVASAIAAPDSLNLAGKTDIAALITLLQQAQLLVCSDSGPVHLAAAVGTKVLGLYGPTRPTQTAPYGPPEQIKLLSHPLPCSPCYGTPLQKRCRDNRCMQAMSADEVATAVKNWLR
ncbi:glycosyltransferase family 9 protein [Ectothiorhodospiraceae bacterium BW-2]|nr:glycosyltransferase family 9 protein [Ectothiorhodospiraceae bacterium BW-2]